jgi:hypothetical protein
MAVEYYKPMLDVGSPRVFNCNVLTRRVLAKDPSIPPFFRNKPLNNLVLIKDTLTEDERRGRKSAIGTKLYFPFNENDVYEGGRTIFAHDKHLEQALIGAFGEGAINKEALIEDRKILAILDRLPSLDPFLLKDVFLNEVFTINEAYFEVGKEIWDQIQQFILQLFEPVVKEAYPDTLSSDEKVRRLIDKIWEARDLEALKPLVEAFRLPPAEALEIFAAWKGINFYSFESERAKPLFVELLAWIKDLKMPVAAVSTAERNELKAAIELVKTQLRSEWQNVDTILRNYQDSYDKMFKLKTSSAEFVAFLKNSSKHYWELGNSLGKIGQATYCWNITTKRFPERKLGWEPLREIMTLLAKIFKPDQKATTSVAWN